MDVQTWKINAYTVTLQQWLQILYIATSKYWNAITLGIRTVSEKCLWSCS